MMTRALRRAGWTLIGGSNRADVPAPPGAIPARDTLLSAHLRWLEMVGRETSAVPIRNRRPAMIAAPVVTRSFGRHAW
jgi:hypothetical protein